MSVHSWPCSCGGNKYVMDSRQRFQNGPIIRRKRICDRCGKRMFTVESEVNEQLDRQIRRMNRQRQALIYVVHLLIKGLGLKKDQL